MKIQLTVATWQNQYNDAYLGCLEKSTSKINTDPSPIMHTQ